MGREEAGEVKGRPAAGFWSFSQEWWRAANGFKQKRHLRGVFPEAHCGSTVPRDSVCCCAVTSSSTAPGLPGPPEFTLSSDKPDARAHCQRQGARGGRGLLTFLLAAFCSENEERVIHFTRL